MQLQCSQNNSHQLANCPHGCDPVSWTLQDEGLIEWMKNSVRPCVLHSVWTVSRPTKKAKDQTHVPNMHPVFKFVCFCYRNQLSLLHSQGSNDCYTDGSLAFQTNDRNMHAQILWLTKSISSDHLLINHLSFPSPSSSSSTPPSSSPSPSSCSGLERHQQLHPRPSAAFSTLPGEWADISSGDIHTCRMIMIFYMMMIMIFCIMIMIIILCIMIMIIIFCIMIIIIIFCIMIMMI